MAGRGAAGRARSPRVAQQRAAAFFRRAARRQPHRHPLRRARAGRIGGPEPCRPGAASARAVRRRGSPWLLRRGGSFRLHPGPPPPILRSGVRRTRRTRSAARRTLRTGPGLRTATPARAPWPCRIRVSPPQLGRRRAMLPPPSGTPGDLWGWGWNGRRPFPRFMARVDGHGPVSIAGEIIQTGAVGCWLECRQPCVQQPSACEPRCCRGCGGYVRPYTPLQPRPSWEERIARKVLPTALPSMARRGGASPRPGPLRPSRRIGIQPFELVSGPARHPLRLRSAPSKRPPSRPA